MIYHSKSETETQKIAEGLGNKLNRGFLSLYGNLGAGKTTFVRGLAKGLAVKSKIQSPTFTYARVHEGRVKLYHFDFYRLNQPDHLLLSEMNEALARDDGIVAVEWPEKMQKFLPKDHMKISLEYINDNERKITFHFTLV